MMDRERPRASESEGKIPEAWIGQEVMLETTEALSSDLGASAPVYLEDVNDRGIVMLVTRHKDQNQFSRYFYPCSVVGWIRLAEEDERSEPRAGVPESPGCPPVSEVRGIVTTGRSPGSYSRPAGRMLAALGYNGTVGYRITAAEGEAGVTLTDHEWRALVYVASNHDYSAPHLRLEEGEETLDVEAADAEGLRSALGKALEARGLERMRTPDGELYYDTIQRVRHVLLSGGVRLARTPA